MSIRIERTTAPKAKTPAAQLGFGKVFTDHMFIMEYEDAVVPGGKIFVDSSLIERKVKRPDVEVFYVPATAMAAENGLDTLANMILVGKLIRESGIVDFTSVDAVLDKIVSAKRAELKAFNKQALELGYNYVG